jgi:hypothetical protein
VSTDVSEKHITSIFRVEEINGTCLLACWFLAELISSTLKMEAICSSQGNQRTTRRYIPEVDTLHNHRCENLKTYIDFLLV